MRALALCLLAVPIGAAGGGWQARAPLPTPRSEVVAASFDGGVAVIGGFLANGTSSKEVDLYRPETDSWRRLPDLPAAVNHAMAASARGKLYVVGGYAQGFRVKRRAAFVLERRRWRTLPPMPAVRAAGGAVVVSAKLYVVGGVGPAGLSRRAFVLDLKTQRWSSAPGPTPREHLAVAAAEGRIYALAGRLGGFDSNLALFEVYSPGSKRWLRLPPVPSTRGGTGAAVAGGVIVSVGGEEPAGTIASVFGYDLARGRWRRLPDLPAPRHGLGVAAVGRRVYAVGGGTSPGLSVSAVNEVLDLGSATHMLVAALGDSITAGSPGYDPDPDQRALRGFGSDERSQWEYWAHRKHPRLEFRNCGVYGERTDQIARRLRHCAKGADALVVQGGINDIAQGRPVEQAAKNLRRMVQRGKELGLSVAIANVLPWNNGYPAADPAIRNLNRLIAEIAGGESVPVLPFYATLEDPRRPGRMRGRWTSDGDHPSVEGYRRLGERAFAVSAVRALLLG